MTEAFSNTDIDWGGLSPLIALAVGIVLAMFAGTVLPSRQRPLSTLVAVLSLGSAAGLLLWQRDEIGIGEAKELVNGALVLDDIAAIAGLLVIVSAAVAVALGWRESAFNGIFGAGGQGEFHSLLLGAVLGGVAMAMASNLVVAFLALELFSIPLYVLCGASIRRRGSLESGLKYLIIGSLGSATFLFGTAFVFGASGATDFGSIEMALANGIDTDSLLLIGVAFVTAGAAFKLSLAPFHQWTPDVYQGAPTPVTAFMSVATKVAMFALVARLFEAAMAPSVDLWQPALAAVAALSIVIGNVGALGQDSLKRMLGYSSIAQGGYMVIGLVVATAEGLNALFFYLCAYALINLAVFGAITLRERVSKAGDDIRSIEGLGLRGGSDRWLAIALTVGMIGLAGLPGTAGFMGKLYLISAAADDWLWLAILIAVGTMVSLIYYLRVVAAVWFKPVPEDDGLDPPAELAPLYKGGATGRTAIVTIIVAFTVLTVFFGIFPQPLVEFAESAATALF